MITLLEPPVCADEQNSETAPATPPAYTRPVRSASPSPAPLAGKGHIKEPLPRVLIVEDQKDLAMCMEMYLATCGYQVVVAPTARRAYAALASETFGLVLLDVDLPDGNGLEICQWIRQASPQPRVPVCFCTGRDPVEMAEKAKQLDAQVLSKIFTMDELVHQVRRNVKPAGR